MFNKLLAAKKSLLACSFLCFNFIICIGEQANIQENYLRCEMLVNPLDISNQDPRLTREINSNVRNIYQKNYHVLVASSVENLNSHIGDLIIRDLFDAKEIVTGKSVEPLIADCCLLDLQFATGCDTEGRSQGFFFAAKGGHNGESHNHNDVGNFILYYNGLSVLVEVGVRAYSKETFSSKRYTIWTMQSCYYNLPVINGVEQQDGRKLTSRNLTFASTNNAVNFSLDNAGAYPESAMVDTGKRSCILNFMTACKVTIDKPGVVRLDSDGFVLEMTYSPFVLEAQAEPVSLTDGRLKSSLGNCLSRIAMGFSGNKQTGDNRIMIK
jgi:hypothetical protein